MAHMAPEYTETIAGEFSGSAQMKSKHNVTTEQHGSHSQTLISVSYNYAKGFAECIK